MFTTGTEPCSASSSSVSCGPVRTQIACTKRDSTSAVSRTDSPRESCISPSRSTIGVPPSSATPTSNEMRVRVEGRSKISATLRPSSAREIEAVGLELGGAVEQRPQLLARNLLSGEEMTSHPGIVVAALTWNLFHGRDHPPAARRGPRRRQALAAATSSPPCSTGSAGRSRCSRRRRRAGCAPLGRALPGQRRAGADLAQRAAVAARGDRRPRPRT